MSQQLEIFPELNSDRGYRLSLLRDFLVRICPLLAKGEVLTASAAACSLRQSGALENCDLMFLSLKTSKDCSQVTEDATLSDFCKRLPTLGVMTANGNLSILTGFYPKIASGFTLSDVLEPSPAAKYFLSEAATRRLLSHQTRMSPKFSSIRAAKPGRIARRFLSGYNRQFISAKYYGLSGRDARTTPKKTKRAPDEKRRRSFVYSYGAGRTRHI